MKTAIITGASTGVGLEYVRQIREVFPDIQEYWVIARRLERLQAIEVPGVQVVPLALDLTDAQSFQTLSAMLEEKKPEVSLLVGNAGCGFLGNFDESPLDDQLWMIDLNVRALTAITRIVLPYLVRGGHIINMASIASFVPNPRMTVYSATKFFVAAFSRGLHEELKPRQISVTAVCPGPMATEFIEVGRIAGKSKTFDVLPYCDPAKVVAGALRAAKKGRAVYTPRALYKFYRVLASLVPHAVMIKFTKT